MNYKGKEVEGCELKLNRLTADKKQRTVGWSPLSETGQKKLQYVCHYNPHSFVVVFIILFTLFRTEFFQYPDAFKNWDGGVYLKRIHNKITGQAYVLPLLFLRYRQAA
ncbi:MAG: hypothetical protein LGB06_07705 [Sulfurovum sp.]|nr:hypothetical protein [Sulfurovum sp.]